MIKTILKIKLIALLLTLSACNNKKDSSNFSVAPINLSYMDTTVRPQDDFYNYVNGTWQKNTKIPSDLNSIDVSDILTEKVLRETMVIIDSIINNDQKPGSEEEKFKNLYITFTDTKKRDSDGLQPIKSELDEIDAIHNLNDLQNYLIKATKQYKNKFYGWHVLADIDKDANKSIVGIYIPGLNLNGIYFDTSDNDNVEVLKEYKKYISEIFITLGDNAPEQKAAEMLDFEIQIMNLIKKNKGKNRLATSQLKNLSKNIDLEKYLREAGVNTDTVLINTSYFSTIDKLLNPDNLSTIKNYLKFSLVNKGANYLTSDLDRAHFNFYNKYLEGQEEMSSKETKFSELVTVSMSDFLGRKYVERHFPANGKKQIELYVEYIKKAYEERIKKLDWMSEPTKKRALEKLNKMKVNIAYPDVFKDYTDLKIESPLNGATLYSNYNNILESRYNNDLAEVGKPVDKSKWFDAAYAPSAYYLAVVNQIFFPAAFLQAPYYNENFDPAINFGGIGSTIAHEITHGFDNYGSYYDGDGNRIDWWEKEDREMFNKKVQKLIEQFNQYEPIKGYFIDGKLTSGENIADLGGISIAYDALQMYLKDYGDPGLIDGFTQNQRFFINVAATFKDKRTEQFIKNQLKTNSHAPGYYRTNGPLINIDAFINVFDVKEGDKMYKKPEDRITIW